MPLKHNEMSKYSLRDTKKKKKVYDFLTWFAPRLILLVLAAGLLTRILLLFIPPTVIGFTFLQWVKIFTIGPLNDLAFAILSLAPAALIYLLLNDAKYRKVPGWILLGLLAALTVYAFLPKNIFVEYGSVVPLIARIVSLLLLAGFALRFFLPGIRKGWCKAGLIALTGIYTFLFLLNILSECTFWYEFGVRYNFIAVDYLVYTNEVIGNIFESYPILPMFLGILVATLLVWRPLFGRHDLSEAGNGGALNAGVRLIVYAFLFAASVGWLHFSYRSLQSRNTFATELQCNGCWNFLEAYSSSTLEYDRFYEMLPEEEVRAQKLALCAQRPDGTQAVRDSLAPIRKNIVLITVESLSADFLTAYGNTEGITPNLDTLMERSLVFDRLYATGNRSVRGLEALTLCIPPSAGESLIKRPDNADLFSTGKVLRQAGYRTAFIYGGDSYFDNMRTYFEGNGYEILDKGGFDKEKITFANIWGTCDEDSFREALGWCDARAAEGTPFHAQVFTISNHRPYTYPDGRITYEGEKMSRQAAVKYTDYAIGQFLHEASSRPWFKETVFVVVADHCASSAGKTSIPVDKYHIPALIYAPGFIAPGRVEKLCSQIDLMPTLFSLLHFSYDSAFYGQDVLAPDFHERAFMATYQDLGFLQDDILTVLSPVGRVLQFDVSETAPWVHTETLRETPAPAQRHEAQVFYQSVNLKY